MRVKTKETIGKKCYPACTTQREEQSMSKFQAEYNIAHQSFEDFILVIYVLVDQCQEFCVIRIVDLTPFFQRKIFRVP